MRITRNRALTWVSAAAIASGAGVIASGALAGPGAPAGPPSFAPIGTYATGITGGTSGESSAFAKGRLFVTNSTGNSLDIVDARDPAHPALVRRVNLSPWGAGPNSVDVSDGLVAVAVEASPKTAPGRVVFLRANGDHVADVAVGALPDMVTFDDEGRQLIVANEGEPSGYGVADALDPVGSVSIISTRNLGRSRGPEVRTVGFGAFDTGSPRHGELPTGIRLNGPGASVAQDLEPEYITVSAEGRTAHVTLQEANAVAEIDLRRARVTRIVALGTKDHSIPGAGLDPSDRDGANLIGTWPVRGMYMPDAIASFQVRGRGYLITANEGDGRDWPGFADEARASTLPLDPTAFPNSAALKAASALGRLTVSKTDGLAADGEYEALYAFGARSATIWSQDGRRVWDSGDQIEQRVAAEQPAALQRQQRLERPRRPQRQQGPRARGRGGRADRRPHLRVRRPRAGRRVHGLRRQRPRRAGARPVGEQPRLHPGALRTGHRPGGHPLRRGGRQPHAAPPGGSGQRGERHGHVLRSLPLGRRAHEPRDTDRDAAGRVARGRGLPAQDPPEEATGVCAEVVGVAAGVSDSLAVVEADGVVAVTARAVAVPSGADEPASPEAARAPTMPVAATLRTARAPVRRRTERTRASRRRAARG